MSFEASCIFSPHVMKPEWIICQNSTNFCLCKLTSRHGVFYCTLPLEQVFSIFAHFCQQLYLCRKYSYRLFPVTDFLKCHHHIFFDLLWWLEFESLQEDFHSSEQVSNKWRLDLESWEVVEAH